MQGFYFARPLSTQAIAQLMQDGVGRELEAEPA